MGKVNRAKKRPQSFYSAMDYNLPFFAPFISDLNVPFLHGSICGLEIGNGICEDLYKIYTTFSSLVFILPWT